MEIRIFDVEHGFCALVIADNGNTMLIDCGHNSTTGFHPYDYLTAIGCTSIESFFVTNFDEDHVSGLPKFRANYTRLPIHILHRNTSVLPEQLITIKREGGGAIGPGIAALISMMHDYKGAVTAPPYYPSVEFSTFHADYPDFTDTNNLSLVLFVHYPGISIIFPGDLEKAGWRHLLEIPAFRYNLSRVNLFVASHHGRENGYLPEVFELCTPDVVIISDTAIQYETQENQYRNHVKGITWNQADARRVLTTRKDGMLTISSRSGDGYYIQASR